MRELQYLMNEIRLWSDATFGDGQRNPAIAYHLKKEVEELIYALENEPNNHEDEKLAFEFADCFMLLLDSASHAGINAAYLLQITNRKLAINKKRKWGKPDKNGVVEHINEEHQ